MVDHVKWDELQDALTEADPAAVLMAPRFVRRVIRLDRDLPGLGLFVPHRKSYVVGRDVARALVRPDECTELHKSRIPPIVMLIAGPDSGKLARSSKADILRVYSRRLFHAAVDRYFKMEWLPVRNRTDVRERIVRIGQAQFDEIRAILRDEGYLLPPITDAAVYAEFCAVYFEFERFAPKLLHQYFPSISHLDELGAVLREDAPADELFARALLPGAAEPHADAVAAAVAESSAESPFDPWTAANLKHVRVQALRYRFHRSRALRAARHGNDVRAALRNIAAYRVAPFPFVEEAKAEAEKAVARLVRRLTIALQLDEAGAASMARLIPTMLPGAAAGHWNQAARLLYDLQNACVDHEKDHYAVDIWAWALSLGRTPLKRPLPFLPEILAARHLRSAARRVGRIPMPPKLREEWTRVVRTAAHAAAEVVRSKFGPILAETLRANGLTPENAVDRIAFDKLVAETLDVVVAKGRFSLGNLRDVVSRNDFKLPDVKDFRDFRTGGSLLRVDRALTYIFDGVYRGGEFYLRWLLQFTSLAYGTRIGRFVTKHFALPVGLSVLLVEGLQHTLFVGAKLAFRLLETPNFANRWTTLFFALVIYAAIHSREFASRMANVGKAIGSALKIAFVDWPARLLQWPAIQKFVNSTAFTILRRAFLFPMAVAVGIVEVAPVLANTILHVVLPNEEFSIIWPQPPLYYLALAFLPAAVVFMSPLGRRMENFVIDRATWTWRRVRFDLVPGLIRLVVDFFHLLLEGMERVLYAVDERLRFHAGESQWSLVWKAAASSVWTIVEYAVRCVVNLVVEPQVNPVKHFPVVTVSHKIFIPATPTMTQLLTPVLGTEYAILTVGTLTVVVPGVCGFLAWELLMNWRLYEATRPETLKPAPIGSHGETMTRLLRPGFHSGTIPKLFAKMRRARRQEEYGGSPQKVDRLHDELEHVAESVESFVRRELLRTLSEHPAWKETTVEAEHVTLASNRVVVALGCAALGDDLVRFAFEEQLGWLAAGIVDFGWLAAATEEQRNAFAWALAGLYKRCGVPIVREQLWQALQKSVPDAETYDLADVGLIVWRSDPNAGEIVYDLATEDAVSLPKSKTDFAEPLVLRDALYSRTLLTWAAWSAYWNSAATKKEWPPGRVLPR
jgi:hypothetical protein